MLKSTAYLRPCSVRQQNSPSKLEGVPEGEGVCLCRKIYSLERGVL